MSTLVCVKDCYNSSAGAGSSASSSRMPGSPKGDSMFSRSNLPRTILFLSIFLIATATSYAAAPDDQPTTSSFGVIHTYLMPDLSLKSVFSVPVLAQPATGFRKTCRCSCGTGSCATDADCGGGVGSCSHFISCCARGEKTQWFLGAEQSSRKTELPAFNGSCN